MSPGEVPGILHIMEGDTEPRYHHQGDAETDGQVHSIEVATHIKVRTQAQGLVNQYENEEKYRANGHIEDRRAPIEEILRKCMHIMSQFKQ